MASIKDFFASGTTITMERPTHGTSGQCCNWNCNSPCCFCLPTSATSWTMEAWGQGGGGGGACCCSWGCRGGSGSDWGYYRNEGWSCGSSQTLCNCVCMCFCCSPSQPNGHPGQFSRICNCTTQNFMCIGGGQSGFTCCNYGGTPSYLNDICPDYDFNASGGGGANSAGDGVTVNGWANATTTCWNSCNNQQGNPFQWGGATTSSGGGGEDFYWSPSTTCSSGWHKCGTYESSSCMESRKGTFGFSRLNGQCNVSCIRGGGGTSYSGGFQSEGCGNTGNWAYFGCSGLAPGGGAVGAGACGGGCCCGGTGAMGAILMSWDN